MRRDAVFATEFPEQVAPGFSTDGIALYAGAAGTYSVCLINRRRNWSTRLRAVVIHFETDTGRGVTWKTIPKRVWTRVGGRGTNVYQTRFSASLTAGERVRFVPVFFCLFSFFSFFCFFSFRPPRTPPLHPLSSMPRIRARSDRSSAR